MSDRPGSLGLNLLLLALSLAFTALVAEGGLRLLAHFQNQGLLSTALASPVPIPADGRVTLGHMIRLSSNARIIYEFKPDLDVTFIDAPVTINSAGFRGPLHPEAKPPGTRRIVGIGDSFMFGHGVGDTAVYMQVLEELLNSFAVDTRFETVNTAVPGYNTVMEVETLRAKGLAYEPDVVLIHFVGNDLELPNFIRVEKPVLALDRSYLADLLRGAFTSPTVRGALRRHGLERSPQVEGARRFVDNPEDAPPKYRSMVGWDAWDAAIAELAELGQEHGFRPVLITFSVTFAHRQQRVLEVAWRHGIETLEVGETFREYLTEQDLEEYRGSPLALSDENMHPSVLGHGIAARVIYRWLCERQFSAQLSSCELTPWDTPGGSVPATAAGP
ncbi:MAG: SGNH/GDSL hydrolase family protein [Thermoanaerobaculia bacterium]